ncbi:MAG: CHAD domain-containing protein [Leptospiraceae bacterium]|nr:CHAD domain-containing protein [Leptospiraceae bacterium]MCP5498271.1 CHAD domain-containing protein [Leptospiraceae bacterium]
MEKELQTFQVFGAKAIILQFTAILKEIKGVKKAKDIEYVHRMRVASRRLRRNLIVFEDIIGKDATIARKKIKKLTQTLGNARDYDVQIEFLERFKSKLPSEDYIPGITNLQLNLQDKRKKEQKKIVRFLDNLLKDKKLKKNLRNINKLKNKKANLDEQARIFIQSNVNARILSLLNQILSKEDYLYDPSAKKELHETRILFKFLRYELEIFQDIYPEKIKSYIDTTKEFQALLGCIHDCDVWIDSLPEFIRKMQKDNKNDEQRAHYERLKTGLVFLSEDREKERERLYMEFMNLWKKSKDNHLSTQFQEILYLK